MALPMIILLFPLFLFSQENEAHRAQENVIAGKVGLKSSPVKSSRAEEIPLFKKDEIFKEDPGTLLETNLFTFYRTFQEEMTTAGFQTGAKAEFIKRREEQNKAPQPLPFKTALQGAGTENIHFVYGSCSVPRTYTVIERATINTYCATNMGTIRFFGELQANHKNYELRVIPVELQDVQGKRFRIEKEESYVTNYDGSSYNIATTIDTRKIDRYNREVQKVVAQESRTQTNRWLSAKEQSQQSSTQTVTDNGDTITAQNTEVPDSADYILAGTINAGTKLVEKLADIFTDEYWLYSIEAGSKFQINLSIKENR